MLLDFIAAQTAKTAEERTRLEKVAQAERVISRIPDYIIKDRKYRSKVSRRLNQKCSQCRIGKIVAKNGKFGQFFGCSNYPECNYSIHSPRG